jgi:hypothetical protein
MGVLPCAQAVSFAGSRPYHAFANNCIATCDFLVGTRLGSPSELSANIQRARPRNTVPSLTVSAFGLTSQDALAGSIQGRTLHAKIPYIAPRPLHRARCVATHVQRMCSACTAHVQRMCSVCAPRLYSHATDDVAEVF